MRLSLAFPQNQTLKFGFHTHTPWGHPVVGLAAEPLGRAILRTERAPGFPLTDMDGLFTGSAPWRQSYRVLGRSLKC